MLPVDVLRVALVGLADAAGGAGGGGHPGKAEGAAGEVPGKVRKICNKRFLSTNISAKST